MTGSGHLRYPLIIQQVSYTDVIMLLEKGTTEEKE